MATETPAHSLSTFPFNLNTLPQKVSGIVPAQTPSKLHTSFCLPLVVAEVNTVLAIELSMHCQEQPDQNRFFYFYGCNSFYFYEGDINTTPDIHDHKQNLL